MLMLWALLSVSPQRDEVPVFKGGKRALESFISEHLIYPSYSRQNCIQGTIQVSFKLTRTGKVFDSKVQHGYGIDLDEEALRIIRLTSGRWTVPASFDTVNALIIPINFSLREYNCTGRSERDIREAINAYRAQEELTGAVTNFYEKKQNGKYSPEDEQKINQLKEQLGYDDEFVARMLKQARQKIKQGDKEGACEDLQFIRKIGSSSADKLIEENCK